MDTKCNVAKQAFCFARNRTVAFDNTNAASATQQITGYTEKSISKSQKRCDMLRSEASRNYKMRWCLFRDVRRPELPTYLCYKSYVEIKDRRKAFLLFGSNFAHLLLIDGHLSRTTGFTYHLIVCKDKTPQFRNIYLNSERSV